MTLPSRLNKQAMGASHLIKSLPDDSAQSGLLSQGSEDAEIRVSKMSIFRNLINVQRSKESFPFSDCVPAFAYISVLCPTGYQLQLSLTLIQASSRPSTCSQVCGRGSRSFIRRGHCISRTSSYTTASCLLAERGLCDSLQGGRESQTSASMISGIRRSGLLTIMKITGHKTTV